LFVGKIVADTFTSSALNFPRYEEGGMPNTSLVTGVNGVGAPAGFDFLKQVIKPSITVGDTRTVGGRSPIFFPIYLDNATNTNTIPSNYFSYDSASYPEKIGRLGRLFIIYQNLPFYLSYVDPSDPRGLNLIFSGFLNDYTTNRSYRGIFRIFNRTSVNTNFPYDIVTNKCFDSAATGTCINNERNYIFGRDGRLCRFNRFE
jgi:hypothetical protein